MTRLLRALLVGALLALFTRTYLVQLYRVPSDSMMPTLLPGDHVVVDRYVYGDGSGDGDPGPVAALLPARSPRRFDIVVVKRPDGNRLIKRLLGLPGEKVELEGSRLRVDGRELEEEAAYLRLPTAAAPAADRSPPDFGPLRLGPEEYLVLGDHRGASLDSRSFGPVARRELVGRAFLIYWSFDLGRAEEASSFDKIPQPARSRRVKARWSRCFLPLR